MRKMAVGSVPLRLFAAAGICLAVLGAALPGTARGDAARMDPEAGRPAAAVGLGWRIVARVTVAGKLTELDSVVVAGAGDAWAAGLAGPRLCCRGIQPVIEHWSGRAWHRVAVPPQAAAALVRRPAAEPRSLPTLIAGASSARNVWFFNQLTGVWLRWDGRRWSHGALPSPAGATLTVTSDLALSSDEVWAFGGTERPDGHIRPYAARFDGRRWVMTMMPRVPGMPVSAASPDGRGGIWATIGSVAQEVFYWPGPRRGALVRWTGSQWRREPLPARFGRNGDPDSVAVSGRNVWVGGGVMDKARRLGDAAARWDGSTWRLFRLPVTPSKAPCVLRSIVPVRSVLLGLGGCFYRTGLVTWRLWRLSDGRWARLAVPRLAGAPAHLVDMAGTWRTGSAWAVGYAGRTAAVIALYGPVPRR